MRPILLTNTDGEKIVLNANVILSVIPRKKGTEVSFTDLSYYIHDVIVQETPEAIFSMLRN